MLIENAGAQGPWNASSDRNGDRYFKRAGADPVATEAAT